MADRSGASGCGRRVSLKRRTSAGSAASRKISTGLRSRIAFRLAVHPRELLEHLAFAHVDDDRGARDLACRRAASAPRASAAARPAGCRRRSSRGPRARGSPATCRARQAGEHDEPRRDGRPRGAPRGMAPLRLRARIRQQILSDARARGSAARRPSRAAGSRPLDEPPRRVVAARAQQLVARRDLDQDRDVAAGRDRHPHHRHADAEQSRSSSSSSPSRSYSRPAPSARAGRPARRASTTASRRRRTGPAR